MTKSITVQYGIPVFFLGVAFMCLLELVTGQASGQVREKVQREALKAGAAHYVIDVKTGEPRFEWIRAPTQADAADAADLDVWIRYKQDIKSGKWHEFLERNKEDGR